MFKEPLLSQITDERQSNSIVLSVTSEIMIECFPSPFVSRDVDVLEKRQICLLSIFSSSGVVRRQTWHGRRLLHKRKWLVRDTDEEFLFLELALSFITRRWIPLHPLRSVTSFGSSFASYFTVSLANMKRQRSSWFTAIPSPHYCVFCKCSFSCIRAAISYSTRKDIRNKTQPSFHRSLSKWKASVTLKHCEMKHSSSMEPVGVFRWCCSGAEEIGFLSISRLHCATIGEQRNFHHDKFHRNGSRSFAMCREWLDARSNVYNGSWLPEQTVSAQCQWSLDRSMHSIVSWKGLQRITSILERFMWNGR